MKVLTRFAEKASFYLSRLSMFFLFIMMFFMVLDIFLRFAFNMPILGSVEIVSQMMALVVFFAFAQTQVRKGHIHVDLIVNIVPNLLKRIFEVIVYALMVLTTVFITYAQYLQTVEIYAQKQVTGVLYLPMFPFYLIVFIGILLFFFVLVLDFIKAIINLFKPQKPQKEENAIEENATTS
ncbi:MAG: TRAP transporter small permease [Desulfitobacteriia bacterium]